MAHIIRVLELPPRAFYRIRVKEESLYGINLFFFSAKAEITYPNTDRDLLIDPASLNLSPVAPVLPTFSEPAKSTKLITDNLFFVIYLNSIYIIVCALLEVEFI